MSYIYVINFFSIIYIIIIAMEKKKLDSVVEDMDSIYMNNDSENVARLSCGGAIELCKAIWKGDIQNGIAVIR